MQSTVAPEGRGHVELADVLDLRAKLRVLAMKPHSNTMPFGEFWTWHEGDATHANIIAWLASSRLSLAMTEGALTHAIRNLHSSRAASMPLAWQPRERAEATIIPG